MPSPNEHACEMPGRNRGPFVRIRRQNRQVRGKTVGYSFGVREDGGTVLRTMYFPKSSWTPAQARAVCSDAKGSFAAATSKSAFGALVAKAREVAEAAETEAAWEEFIAAVATAVEGVQADDEEAPERFVVVKSVDEQRLVYGVVQQPDLPDAQGDTINADELRDAAHHWMRAGGELWIEHGKKAKHADAGPARSRAAVVESYLAPADMEVEGQAVKAGTWMMTVHVPDDDAWADVKAGRLVGFSPQGITDRKAVLRVA